MRTEDDELPQQNWAGSVWFDFIRETSVEFKEFDQGIRRVRVLLSVQELVDKALENDAHSGISVQDDVLRAATVLLHAIFETYLREVSRRWLKTKAKYESIDVPFTNSDEGASKEKITSQDLFRYRDKTVKDLLYDSIDHYLEAKSFGNGKIICRFLDEIGIPIDPLRKHLGTLDKLILRRHSIVHSADIDGEQRKVRTLDRETVETWLNTSVEFALKVQYSIHGSDLFLKELEERVRGLAVAEQVVEQAYQYRETLLPQLLEQAIHK